MIGFACESNEDSIDNSNQTITSADLLGTWNLTKQTMEEGSSTVTSDGETYIASFSSLAKNINYTFTFAENPNKINFQGTYTLVTSTSIMGQNMVEEKEIDTSIDLIEPLGWSLINNSLTIVENVELPEGMIIEEFTSNSIKLKGQIEETYIEDDELVALKATMYIELER
jgi:hypothetical protein